MKKLIFFAYSLDMGGIENALINLLNRIDHTKYEITLILEKKEGIFLDKVPSYVKVQEFKVSNFKFTPFRKIYNYTKRFLWKLRNKNKYDFSCCYATYSLLGSSLSKIASPNSSIYVHGDYTYIYKEKKDFYNFFNQRNIDKFKTIFFVSNESKQHFLELYDNLKDKAVVINNFIDEKQIIEKANMEIKKDKAKKLFVYVGRCDEKQKKVSRLLHIISALDVNLWIVGDGPDKESYIDYVNENSLNNKVTFLGMQANPYPYMKAADYIILTSDYEGFPVIYLEALILGKRIITTIDVSDDYLSISDYADIIPTDEKQMIEDIKLILKQKRTYPKLNFNDMNKEKLEKLEKIFNK